MPEQELQPTELPISDPHVAFMQTVAGIAKNKNLAVGLNVLDLKGLVDRVIISQNVFSTEQNPRLDFQPIIIVFSETFKSLTNTELIVLGNRFYGLGVLASRLSTKSEQVREMIRGKTFNQLDPRLQALVQDGKHPLYKDYTVNTAIEDEIAKIKPRVDQTITASSQTPLKGYDITTISHALPDRQLTAEEQVYLQVVAAVAQRTSVDDIGAQHPIGLSETYLYDIWNGVLKHFPNYQPLMDFDPVVAAISPHLEQTTGIRLYPAMQLFARNVVPQGPLTATIESASPEMQELIGGYDNVATENALHDELSKLQ